MPNASPDALVLARSFRKLWEQIVGTTLAIDGFAAVAARDGASFIKPPQAPVAHPWQVTSGDDGFIIEPGLVRGLDYLGNDELVPEIDGVPLDDPATPALPLFNTGIIAIELNVRFIRGTDDAPYDTTADLTSMPAIKALADITLSAGTIDGTDYSYGTFGVAIAGVSGGRVYQLMKRDFFVRSHITTILPV